MAAYGYRVGAIKAQIDLTEKHAFYDKSNIDCTYILFLLSILFVGILIKDINI